MNNKIKPCFVYCGRQDCSNMHSWGPGIRTNYVIHYVIRGKGTFVNGGKAYALSAGQSFLIRPFSEVYYFPDKNDPWEYIWTDFDGEEYVRLIKKIEFYESDCIIGKINSEKILVFYEMLRALNDYNNQLNTADGLARTILGTYADCYPVSLKSFEDAYFEAARLIIQGFYHRSDFGLPYICENLGISRATLHRSFKKNCGNSPGAYLLNYRIDRAKELLERGSSIKSTALSCGFENPLYFSKVFKASAGISPREYRRSFMNKNR